MKETPPRIILASSSRYRSELLARLELPFKAVAPKYDELPLDLPPEKTALVRAGKKAKSLRADFPESLIIGSDQLLSFEGRVLGKPGNTENAVSQLMLLSGKTHKLITAVAVHEARTGRMETALDVHEMTLRPLSEKSIRAYVARDRPLDCAGAYKLESLGITLFSSIKGSDDTAVVGLPLLRLTELLLLFGIDPVVSLG